MIQLICTLCGYAGSVGKKNKGSDLIEVVLWLFFLIPGIIYSIWRRSDKQSVCPKCGNKTMIPADSPQGQRLMAEQMRNPDIKMEEMRPEKISNARIIVTIAVVVMIIISVIIVVNDISSR